MSLRYRSVPVALESLERRSLFSIAYPNAQEQLIVELINRGRAAPAAEAARYGIALNEGVPAGTPIYETPKQPLAINLNLTAAAKDHSYWMIDTGTFSHTGAGGSSPHLRMAAGGYIFTGSWASAENIGYRSSTRTLDLTAAAAQIHADLFIDKNYPDRGHRTNQMDPRWREVGVGVYDGLFGSNGYWYNALMATEDFAVSGTNVFLTGVAYTDAVAEDDFYTVGEGVGGLTVTAVRAGDNATFTTTTWSSGGYALALPPGTYTVSAANGNTLGGTIVHGGVVVGTENVKRDFRPDMVVTPFATLANGLLTVDGTAQGDAVNLSFAGDTLTVTRNGQVQLFTAASVTDIAIYLGDGNDGLTVGDGVVGLYCDGGMGNDHLVGGQFNDTLTGNGNHDKVFGGNGDDRINGSGGHDRLYGENGRDRIHGGFGWDTLEGGAHIDRLFPEIDPDVILGQHGDDLMYTVDGSADHVIGGIGFDIAEADDEDVLEGTDAFTLY